MAASIFAGLSPEAVASVLQPFTRKSFPAGTTLLQQGQVVDEMFVVETGTANVVLTGADRQDHVVNTIGAGETVGEMALFTGQPASATVRALGSVEAVAIDQPAFREIADSFPKIYQNLASLLSDRLAHTNHHVLNEAQGKVTLLTGSPEYVELALGLAASIAWHSRLPTALVFVDQILGNVPEGARGPWLEISKIGSGQSGGAIEALSHRMSNVLVFAGPGVTVRADTTISVRGPGAGIKVSGLAVEAWVDDVKRFRPTSRGLLSMPRFAAEDRAEILRGYLSSSRPAGKVIGWLARHVAHLKTGFVLGAGSVKGYAHFGVLRSLERIGLEPDYITGTSIGAIIASMVALGIPADKSIEIMEATSSKAFRLTLPTRSLLSDSGVRSNFQMIGGDTRFEDVEIPFAAVAADLADGREVILRSGLLRTAVLASMAIPGVYPAIRIAGRTLVDGGIVNPVPISVAALLGADRVVAIPLRDQVQPAPIELEAIESGGKGPGAIANVLRAVEIMQSRIANSVVESAMIPTVFIEPRLSEVTGVSLRTFSQGRPYIVLGERAAEAAEPQLLATFPWLQPLPPSLRS